MSEASPLLREYQRLRDHTSSQRRGYDLQALVGSVLGRAHFKVETKPRAARPRQVDLFASRGETVYLIETKWRKDKADIDMVADSEYLVCALRSWHTLNNPKSAYELWNFESAWTSDALVVRAMADWPDEPDDASIPSPRRDRPPKSVMLALGDQPAPAPRKRAKRS